MYILYAVGICCYIGAMICYLLPLEHAPLPKVAGTDVPATNEFTVRNIGDYFTVAFLSTCSIASGHLTEKIDRYDAKHPVFLAFISILFILLSVTLLIPAASRGHDIMLYTYIGMVSAFLLYLGALGLTWNASNRRNDALPGAQPYAIGNVRIRSLNRVHRHVRRASSNNEPSGGPAATAAAVDQMFDRLDLKDSQPTVELQRVHEGELQPPEPLPEKGTEVTEQAQQSAEPDQDLEQPPVAPDDGEAKVLPNDFFYSDSDDDDSQRITRLRRLLCGSSISLPKYKQTYRTEKRLRSLVM